MSDTLEAVRRRAIWSVIIGGFFELFDFSLFGYFARSIGHNFFPSDDPVSATLSGFATFGVGFVMRPVGGLVLGAYADRYGRKSALVFTLLLMAVATGATGLVPTYASIGIAAPILLVFLRLVQGFSAGGEWGGSTVFLVEFAPPGRRGFFGSWQQFGVALGGLAGSLAAFAMSALLAPEALDSWGWRIPFILGLLIAPVGYFLRRRVGETPSFAKAAAERDLDHSPARTALTSQLPAVLIAAGSTIIWTVGAYSFSTFLPVFAVQQLHLSAATALGIASLAAAVRIALTPLMGILSDRVGRKPMVLTTAIGFLVLSYPLFWWLVSAPSMSSLVCVQIIAAVLIAIFSGAGPAMLCELFPVSVRTTGLSVGYNLVTALFGGFAPFIAQWLVRETGSAVSPSYFVIFAAVLSIGAILPMKDRARE